MTCYGNNSVHRQPEVKSGSPKTGSRIGQRKCKKNRINWTTSRQTQKFARTRTSDEWKTDSRKMVRPEMQEPDPEVNKSNAGNAIKLMHLVLVDDL